MTISLTTPTPTDYMSIFQSFDAIGASLTPEAREKMTESPSTILLNIYPSPIRFDVPGINSHDSLTTLANRSVKIECQEVQEIPLSERPFFEPKSVEIPQRRGGKTVLQLSKLMDQNHPSSHSRVSNRSVQSECAYDEDDEDENDIGNSFDGNDEDYIPSSTNRAKPWGTLKVNTSKPNTTRKTSAVKKSKIILENGEKLMDDDVLGGRGVANCQHPGNLLFRELIRQFKSDYNKAKSDKKRYSIAKKIVDIIKPGRFFKKNVQTGTYFEMGYEASIQKALFAMRDTSSARGYPQQVKKRSVVEKASAKSPKRVKKASQPMLKSVKAITPAKSQNQNNLSDTTTDTGRRYSKRVKKNSVVKEAPAKGPKCFTEATNPMLKSVKTVTPPKNQNQNNLSSFEMSSVERLIEIAIRSPEKIPLLTTLPQTRSEEVYALIEKLVAKGAEVRRNRERSVFDHYWWQPEMQKCIRLQLLQRYDIEMKATGISHTAFFDKLIDLGLFP